MQRLFFLFLFIASFSYGQSGRGQASAMATTLLSGRDSAVYLFEQALELMQRNALRKDISWDSLVTTARVQLSEATSVQDAHAVINQCLERVQGSHSFIMPSRHAALYHNDTTRLKRRPVLNELVGAIEYNMADQGIGYIAVPWMSTSDPVVCTLMADSLQSLIGRLAAQGATRWIIDLHSSTPMCKTSKHVTLADHQRQQIVVLTGPKTSSSGEILALAFKGMPRARLMGEPTAGLTTANTTYDLYDGSTLVLTICREADRHGNICEGKIIPHDIIKPDPLRKDEDVVKDNALMWLQSL